MLATIRRTAAITLVGLLAAGPAAAHEAPSHMHLADGSVVPLLGTLAAVAAAAAIGWLALGRVRRESARRDEDDA